MTGKTNKRIRMVDTTMVTSQSKKNGKGAKHSGSGFTISERVAVPASAGSITGRPRPMIRTRNDSVVVSNTEIFNNINTSNAVATGMNQAMIPSSFTWLSGIAQNFSKYRWVEFEMIYIPSCPTTTAGGITFAMLYDTADSVPASRLAASASYHSVTTPYWAGWEGSTSLSNRNNMGFRSKKGGEVSMSMDVSRVGRPWYSYLTSVNYAAQTGIDRSIYSPGFLVAITDGGPTTSISAGTVFIRYIIELIEPMAVSAQQ